MPDIERGAVELREMDELARMTSPIHCLHPLSKLIVTLVYIFVTASFPKYGFSGLAAMMLYPALLFAISGISVRTCFYKLRLVLPIVCAIGILNPFFDREVLLRVGGVNVSGGVVSMVTLIIKGALCLSASFILAATTPIDAVCGALRRVHVPKMLTSLVLLTYRYISVMIEEASVMVMAYKLRAPGQKGIHFSAWGSFLGQLLLRSMDKAQEIYSSMLLRGFSGDFWYADVRPLRPADILFTLVSVGLFSAFRCMDVSAMIGSFIV